MKLPEKPGALKPEDFEIRPDCNQANKCPSRIGSYLFYKDGRKVYDPIPERK